MKYLLKRLEDNKTTVTSYPEIWSCELFKVFSEKERIQNELFFIEKHTFYSFITQIKLNIFYNNIFIFESDTSKFIDNTNFLIAKEKIKILAENNKISFNKI